MNRLRCMLSVMMAFMFMGQTVYAVSLCAPICKNKDGSLNTVFGTVGTVVEDMPRFDYANGVVVLPCGKIVAVTVNFKLIRWSSYGVKDTNSGFGTDGIVQTNFAQVIDPEQGESDDSAYAIALQKNCNNCVSECAPGCDIDCNKNCKLVVVGSTDALIGGGTGSTSFAVARYDCNGKLDTTFGENGLGIVIIPINGIFDEAYAVAIQDDGKIVVAGSAEVVGGTSDFAVVRLNCDGSLDETFGCQGTGIVTINIGDDYASSVVIQRDGKIVVGGTVYINGSNLGHFGLARLTTRGRLDKTFGNNGIVFTDLGTITTGTAEISEDVLTSLVLVEDCEKCFDERSLNIIAVGYSNVDDVPNHILNNFALVGYKGNGAVNTHFGSQGTGVVTTNFAFAPDQSFDNEALAAVLARDCNGVCKIVVVGFVQELFRLSNPRGFAVARYTINGWLDPFFGFGGKVITVFPSPTVSAEAHAVALQENGNIVAAGRADIQGAEFAIAHVALADYTVCQPCCP